MRKKRPSEGWPAMRKKTVVTRDWDTIRVRKVRRFLKGAPELNVPYVWAHYTYAHEFYASLHLNHGIVQDLGLVDSITYLAGRMHSQGPVPTQTIREVILWSALRMEGLAVNLMNLGVEPNAALDIFIEHKIMNADVYPLLISGVPVEWALKIVAERDAAEDEQARGLNE